jgi:Cof subfamily protein (haloacid dehalogenase superfamily)
MTYQLIAADLDGTLHAEGQPFSPRLRNAVRRAQERGVRIVIATGRIYRTAAPFARDLGLDGAMICNHGATIRDIHADKILLERTVPLNLARELVERASDDLTVLVCVDEEFYTPRLSAHAVEYVGSYREHWHIVPDLACALPGAPQKILFICDESVAASLRLELKIRFGDALQIVQSWGTFVEVTHRDASKGNAVAWLANRWGIARDAVIALGDQGNDISMIEWAGLGVAMGNAIDRVKALADYIAPHADEDGAAVAIEKFVLDGDG